MVHHGTVKYHIPYLLIDKLLSKMMPKMDASTSPRLDSCSSLSKAMRKEQDHHVHEAEVDKMNAAILVK